MNLTSCSTISNEPTGSPKGPAKEQRHGQVDGAAPAPEASDFDIFFGSHGNTWDFGADMSIPTNFFENVSFLDGDGGACGETSVSSLTLSPKTMKMGDGEAVPVAQAAGGAGIEAQAAPLAARSSQPGRRKSTGSALPSMPQGGHPQRQQNWFSLCQRAPPAQAAPASPLFHPAGVAYAAAGGAPSSPYLVANGAPEWTAGGAADPYAWMHSGRPKRGYTGAFQLTGGSPPMLYHPGMAYAGPAPAGLSPTFGLAAAPFGPQPGLMIMPQPPIAIPKLPVQALPPRADPSATEGPAAAPLMAPLILPTDLGRSRSKDGVDIDPNAISNAISLALRSGSGSAPQKGTAEEEPSPASSQASLSPSGIPSATQVENMRLYESTFEAFVKEEAAIDYTNVTVIELKKLLRKYHLAATGRKDELIRLVKDVAQFLKGNPPKTSPNPAARPEPAGERREGEAPKAGTAADTQRETIQGPTNGAQATPLVSAVSQGDKADTFSRFFEMS